MSHVARLAGPSTLSPSGGSRTIVIQDSQPREENRQVDGVLHLRAARRRQPRVTWTEDVVDNEGMGKKKSKICCIYHKPRRYDESSSSSSDSSDSDSDSDSGRAQPGGRLRGHRHAHRPHPHPDSNNQNGENSGSGAGQAMRDGGGSTMVHELSDDEDDANAYEREPGKGKGKDKKVEKDNAQSS